MKHFVLLACIASSLVCGSIQAAPAPGKLSAENPAISLSFDTPSMTFTVVDKRCGQTWAQKPTGKGLSFVGAIQGKGMAFRIQQSKLNIDCAVEVDPVLPEFTVTLSGEGALPWSLGFPYPFATSAGTYLVIPMNEGISYPVDDKTVNPPGKLIAYGGHGICMAFFGATDGERGCMGILETADDAAIRMERVNELLTVAPMWDAQKGQFGYSRKVRYVFFDKGGHVAMAKRYRAHAQKTGLVKTLAEKRKQNPNVDLLIGAANIWCWDRDPVAIVKELQSAGLQRILWSCGTTGENIKAMNAIPDVLTSRYDIYQDTMDPQFFPLLRGQHADWTTEAWANKDIMLDSKGDWVRGWQVTGKDGKRYPCGVLCDKQAPAYADKRIPAELATKPYRCRFIDTTTASPWRECYDPKHPMTRSESKHYKMELLRLVSEKHNLVTGCETGHDASVPFLHYFEGMLSLGPYRVPDSGRDMRRIWTEVPENVAKFQMGEKYRLPLWELVYHDCVVSQWYWGDYNNKLPALWDRRDLFNILYATPPMYMFDMKLFRENKARFVQSYRNIAPVVRGAGYAEMTGHRFLTPDRSVQQTSFANGMVVTVNFGGKPFALPDGATVGAMSFQVKEK